MEELTQENYYQDTSYLTNSRFKRYQQCQAKAFALDSGQWTEERDETLFSSEIMFTVTLKVQKHISSSWMKMVTSY